jgi:hypothetical protein
MTRWALVVLLIAGCRNGPFDVDSGYVCALDGPPGEGGTCDPDCLPIEAVKLDWRRDDECVVDRGIIVAGCYPRSTASRIRGFDACYGAEPNLLIRTRDEYRELLEQGWRPCADELAGAIAGAPWCDR